MCIDSNKVVHVVVRKILSHIPDTVKIGHILCAYIFCVNFNLKDNWDVGVLEI